MHPVLPIMLNQAPPNWCWRIIYLNLTSFSTACDGAGWYWLRWSNSTRVSGIFHRLSCSQFVFTPSERYCLFVALQTRRSGKTSFPLLGRTPHRGREHLNVIKYEFSFSGSSESVSYANINRLVVRGLDNPAAAGSPEQRHGNRHPVKGPIQKAPKLRWQRRQWRRRKDIENGFITLAGGVASEWLSQRVVHV